MNTERQIASAWGRITTWCRDNAPETFHAIRPPAREVEREMADHGGPPPRPPQLRAWYGLCDGAERGPGGYVLPGYVPLSGQEVGDTWIMMRQVVEEAARVVAEQLGPDSAGMVDFDPASFEHDPAGSRVGFFHPRFLPIGGDESGGWLVVDTRSGLQFGCVRRYDKVEADLSPVWASVESMLDDIAASLESSSPTTGIPHRWPVVLDGCLHWDLRIP